MLGRIAVYGVIALLSLGLASVVVFRPARAPVGVRPPEPPPKEERGGSVHPAPAVERVTPPAAHLGEPAPEKAVQLSALPDPRSAAVCPEGMLLVEGTSCGAASRTCIRQDPAAGDTCVAYAAVTCGRGGGGSFRFCIDRREYPNLTGVLPATLITFEAAGAACKAENKRLCREREWTFACEGPSALAFGYGDERREGVCNVERSAPQVRPTDLWEPRDISLALSRVDARTPSGAMAGCLTPFGVEDALGNVEEWVQPDVPGVRAALRGGAFESKGASCNSVRVMESQGFRQVHTGFRCCQDPLLRPHARPSQAPGTRTRPAGGTVAP